MNQNKEVWYVNIGNMTKVNILDVCTMTDFLNDSIYKMILITYLQVSIRLTRKDQFNTALMKEMA